MVRQRGGWSGGCHGVLSAILLAGCASGASAPPPPTVTTCEGGEERRTVQHMAFAEVVSSPVAYHDKYIGLSGVAFTAVEVDELLGSPREAALRGLCMRCSGEEASGVAQDPWCSACTRDAVLSLIRSSVGLAVAENLIGKMHQCLPNTMLEVEGWFRPMGPWPPDPRLPTLNPGEMVVHYFRCPCFAVSGGRASGQGTELGTGQRF
jgi:hypothetical protein